MRGPTGLALVVREDVRDTVRERQFHLLVGLYVLLAALVTYTASRSAAAMGQGPPELLPALLGLYAMLTPLFALGFFASALVEKRAGGALKVVLGLPIAREAVVLGTFLGRSAVLVTAVLGSLCLAAVLGVAFGMALEPVRYLAVALALALLGVVFTAFAIAISAIVRTTTRATVAAFGVFFVFVFQLWAQLPQAIRYVRHGFSVPDADPEWVDAVAALNPVAAYTNVVSGWYPDLEGGTFVQPPRDPALYESPSVGLVVLVGWIVLALGVATWRFRATDL